MPEASAQASASTGLSNLNKQPATASMPWLKSCDRCGCVLQNHQIDQLKEEISGKDLALVKEHFDHMKVCIDSHPKPISCNFSGQHLMLSLTKGTVYI